MVKPSLIATSSIIRRVRRCQFSIKPHEVSWSPDSIFHHSYYALQIACRQRVDAPESNPLCSPKLPEAQSLTVDRHINLPSPLTHPRQEDVNGLTFSGAFSSPGSSELPEAPHLNTNPTTTCSGRLNPEALNTSWGIKAALFGLTDMHTGPITCLPPRERIASPRMPLFPEWAKRVLFVDSQWLMRLDRSLGMEEGCGEPAADEASCRDATPGSEPLTVAPTSEATAVPSTSSISTPRSLSSLYEVAINGAKPRKEAGNDGGFGSSTSCVPAPPLYADVLGRPKIVRCLLYNFLADPTYWCDEVDEILRLAAQKAKGLYGESNGRGVNFEENGCALGHLLRPMESLVFYAPGLREVFRRILDMTPESFIGPIAIWYAFVVAHRQDATRLRSPHQPPFSFAEVNPTLTPHDFDSRKFTHSTDDLTAAPGECKGGSSGPLDSLTEEEWGRMSETQQIKLLFGEDAASELTAATLAVPKGSLSESGDIFIFSPPLTLVDNSGNSASSSAPVNSSKPASQPPGSEAGGDFTHQITSEEIELEQKRHEMLRLYAYVLDQFLLGIIEWSSDFTTGAGCVNFAHIPQPLCGGLQQHPEPPRARKGYVPRDNYYANGLLRSAKSGEVEDVHLGQLWKAFQETDTSTLLDYWSHVRSTLYVVQHELRAEMAMQAAFMLLFFSRDEVRAVTNPRDSYHRIWRLHQELMELLTPISRKAAPPLASNSEKSPPSTATHERGYPLTQFPLFESLPPDQKASYACFGHCHLLDITSTDRPHHVVQCSKGNIGRAEPFALFCDHCAAMHPAHETFLYNEDGVLQRTLISDLTSEQMRIAYQSLTPLQKFAISYCFPRPLKEEAEEASVYVPQMSSAEVCGTNKIKTVHKGFCSVSGDENRLITEYREQNADEVKVAESPSKLKGAEVGVGQLGTVNEFLKALPVTKLEDAQKGSGGLAHRPEAALVEDSTTIMKQKIMENNNRHNSVSPIPITPSHLTGMITALAKSINEAGLEKQLQEIATVLVRLVVEGLEANAHKTASPHVSDSHTSPQVEGSGNSSAPQARKRGRPKKKKNQ